MATEPQIEYIEDLMDQAGVTRDDLEDAGGPGWRNYEKLTGEDVTEVLDWLKDEVWGR